MAQTETSQHLLGGNLWNFIASYQGFGNSNNLMSKLQVHKFLDKNYDQVRQDVLDLFIQSKNKVKSEKHQHTLV